MNRREPQTSDFSDLKPTKTKCSPQILPSPLYLFSLTLPSTTHWKHSCGQRRFRRFRWCETAPHHLRYSLHLLHVKICFEFVVSAANPTAPFPANLERTGDSASDSSLIQVVTLGAVGIVRAGHPAGVHVIEDEVPELGDGGRRRVSGGLGSELRGHCGREDISGKMKGNERKRGKIRIETWIFWVKNESLKSGLGNLGVNSTYLRFWEECMVREF